MTTKTKRKGISTKSDAIKFLEKRAGTPLSIASLLVSIREGEEISQVKFASLLEISRAHLCDIEKGRKGLSPHRAAIFAKKLGYSETLFVRLALQDLVTREGLDLHVEVA
jgi:DNA-binding transcriptional regulator YiaG